MFVSLSGRSDVQEGVDTATDSVRAAFEVTLRYLVNAPRNGWSMPNAKQLQGFRDIHEIRFQEDNTQWRPLGFFGPAQGEFTITVWCSKKQNRYYPQNALSSADSRRKQIATGRASCRTLQIHGADFPPPE